MWVFKKSSTHFASVFAYSLSAHPSALSIKNSPVSECLCISSESNFVSVLSLYFNWNKIAVRISQILPLSEKCCISL